MGRFFIMKILLILLVTVILSGCSSNELVLRKIFELETEVKALREEITAILTAATLNPKELAISL